MVCKVGRFFLLLCCHVGVQLLQLFICKRLTSAPFDLFEHVLLCVHRLPLVIGCQDGSTFVLSGLPFDVHCTFLPQLVEGVL